MHITKRIVTLVCLGAFWLFSAEVKAQQSPNLTCWNDGVHVMAVQDAFPEMSIMDARVMKEALDTCTQEPLENQAIMVWDCGNLFYSEVCDTVSNGSCICSGLSPLFSRNACLKQTEPIATRAQNQYAVLIFSRQMLRKQIKTYLNLLNSREHSKKAETRLRRRVRTGMSLLAPTQIMIYEVKGIIRQLSVMNERFKHGRNFCTRIDSRISQLSDELTELNRKQEHYFDLTAIYVK